jgi:hypothetical protein
MSFETPKTDTLRWTWVGPIAVSVAIALIAAWALQLDRRVTRMEDVLSELVRSRGEYVGKFEIIIEQNRAQDNRTSLISQRLDSLVQMHMNDAVKRK